MSGAPVDWRALIAERGYVILYRPAEPNHCPGCGSSAWHVGRIAAECAKCATAIPLVAPTDVRTLEPTIFTKEG